MTYTIRDLWNDILNIDLIFIGQVIIGVVAIFITYSICKSIFLWWEKKLENDNLITSTLWSIMPLAILIGGPLIYSYFK